MSANARQTYGSSRRMSADDRQSYGSARKISADDSHRYAVHHQTYGNALKDSISNVESHAVLTVVTLSRILASPMRRERVNKILESS